MIIKEYGIDIKNIFHNNVNARLRKPQFKKNDLIRYRNNNIQSVLNMMCYEIKYFYKRILQEPDCSWCCLLINISWPIIDYNCCC